MPVKRPILSWKQAMTALGFPVGVFASEEGSPVRAKAEPTATTAHKSFNGLNAA